MKINKNNFKIKGKDEKEIRLIYNQLLDIGLKPYGKAVDKRLHNVLGFCIDTKDRDFQVCTGGFENCNLFQISYDEFMSAEFKNKLTKMLILNALEDKK